MINAYAASFFSSSCEVSFFLISNPPAKLPFLHPCGSFRKQWPLTSQLWFIKAWKHFDAVNRMWANWCKISEENKSQLGTAGNALYEKVESQCCFDLSPWIHQNCLWFLGVWSYKILVYLSLADDLLSLLQIFKEKNVMPPCSVYF